MQIETTPADLSALIIRGKSMSGITESHTTWLSFDHESGRGVKACAMGMAYAAHVGDPIEAVERFQKRGLKYLSPCAFFESEMGIPVEVSARVSSMHCTWGMTALGIARTITPWKVITSEPTLEDRPGIIRRFLTWFRTSNRPQLRLVTNP